MDNEVTDEILRQYFLSLDKENKGYLVEGDLAGLSERLVSPGDQQPEDAVTQLMEHLDADKDGRVNDTNTVCLSQ